jgi:uncharacterized protein
VRVTFATARKALPLALLVALFAVPATAGAAVVTRGSVGEAYVTGARAGAKLTLERNGRKVATGTADRFGSKIFYELRPGSGYRVTGGGASGKAFRVSGKGENPTSAFYKRIRLKEGLNYVKVRDGIELAMTVRLPAGKKLTDGPFPTVIEYSGYQAAAPGNLKPAGPRQLDRCRLPDRPAARLRHGKRPDARLGLLGRRVRPVRPPHHLRRVRRR